MAIDKHFAGLVLGTATVLGVAAQAEAQAASYLDQGWSSADRQYFYRTTQGSRLMSYRVFMGLETTVWNGSAYVVARFMSPANLSRLGFLFDSEATNNPDGLPIGFVRDSSDLFAPAQIGFTCSTCHTRDVVVPSGTTKTRYRIDGGQGYVDMERFLGELEEALRWASTDATQFARLCANAGATTSTAKQNVRNELDAALAKLTEENRANAPSNGVNNPGPGRLDALAHIKNRVANTVYPGQYTFTANNNIDATAPVSFPFLWDAPYLDHVQYPSNVSNNDLGSLGRNVGQVTGVFAETKTNRTLGVFTASSSANVSNLVEIENRLLKLKSPQWPTGLAPLNQTRVARGDTLFNTYCASCHVEVDRSPRTTWIPSYAVGQSFVQTDEQQAYNNVNDTSLAGQTSSNPAAQVNPLDTLGAIVVSELISEVWRAPGLDASHKMAGAPNDPVTKVPSTLPQEPNGKETLAPGESVVHTYKSRPLNGIWATGPYLHNGSVRTLLDLLLPGAQRPRSFCVGSLEIDTVNVGMNSDCTLQGSYTFDGNLTGNTPVGHEYGTPDDYRVKAGWLPALTAEDRAALVEYMKTL